MPELPEVEFNRKLVNDFCLNLTISKVNRVDDNLIFANEIPNLVGSIILSTDRYGKYLWLGLNDSSFLLIHLGMTGFIQVRGKLRSLYRSAPEKAHSEEWPPRFTKLHVIFEGGGELVYGDARRLGRVIYCKSKNILEDRLKNLGFDPIKTPPSSLKQYLDGRKVPIKSLLLDQKFSAGIGNWMADDILYSSGIHPQKLACNLSDEEQVNLLNSIVYIANKSVELKLANESYPEEWLFHCRWEVRKSRTKSFHSLGRSLQVVKIGGRTTIYCPDKQKFNSETRSPAIPPSENGIEREGDSFSPTSNRPKKVKRKRKA